MRRPILTALITLLTASSASLSAAPVGYAINSDSGSEFHDSLYQIDLATGQEIERVGALLLLPFQTTPLDVEGLAFAPDGTLYGIDDETLTLFPLNTNSASFNNDDQVEIEALTPGSNDFGMTFACDGNLYITSVARQSLYRVSLDGVATRIGPEHSLGVDISALAAFGDPVRLYGLGTGGGGESQSFPNLYEINATDGSATLIGPLGAKAGTYTEGGLAFDDTGQLWAITDRRALQLPSQVMRVSTSSGTASEVQNTTEQGVESLAITPPGGCEMAGNGDTAQFSVQKRFSDGNNITPTKITISCNGGFPLEQSKTVGPEHGIAGNYEVNFSVTEFIGGTLTCEIHEETPTGYVANYECQSSSYCDTAAGKGPCIFENIGLGQDNLCRIQDYVDPVAVVVTKEWLYPTEEVDVSDDAVIKLYCTDVFDGDGKPAEGNGMSWFWKFKADQANHTATVYPDFTGKTQCWTVERFVASAIESDSTCADPVDIRLGDGERNCLVTNTIFFEGIPTLNPIGMVLFAALMLLTGLVAARRF
jgi:hypothetical protein